MAQKGQVSVEYHDDAADEKRNDDGRHNADGAVRHGTFDFAARFARDAAGVHDGQNQHFEKYAADKGDGAIEVDDVGDGVETHDRVPKWIFRRNCIISRVASDDLFLIVGSIVGVARDVQRSHFVY